MSIFKRQEKVYFSFLNISVQGTCAATAEYELKKTDIGMSAAYYYGSWRFNDDIERNDCLSDLKDCDSKVYEKINDIINNVKAVKWNGKMLNNPNVLDGEVFDLEIRLTNGDSISCSGTNAYPAGYHDLYNAVTELFFPQR